MPGRKRSGSKGGESTRAVARTPDERENQLIEAAVDLAEIQLRSGEASAQVITHYLKLGSSRERLEQQRLANEVALLDAKRESLESEMRMETLVSDALQAMRTYTGNSPEEQGPEYDEYD